MPLIDGVRRRPRCRNPVDDKLTDGYMFGHTLSVFHKHWSSRKDGPCPAEVEPGDEGCTQHLDRKAPLYSPQTGLVSYEELLAEAFDDQNFVEILHQATVALAAIKVPGPDGAQIDGITALANMAQRLLTPDPTLFKRDGKTNSTADQPVRATGRHLQGRRRPCDHAARAHAPGGRRAQGDGRHVQRARQPRSARVLARRPQRDPRSGADGGPHGLRGRLQVQAARPHRVGHLQRRAALAGRAHRGAPEGGRPGQVGRRTVRPCRDHTQASADGGGRRLARRVLARGGGERRVHQDQRLPDR